MIKISLIYIGIVVAIAALITGVPMLVWTDETADKVEQVANLPIAKLIAPDADAGAGAGAGRGASGFGSAEAGGSETSAPVAPLPSGVEAATAALLQGLSEPAPEAAASAVTQAAPDAAPETAAVAEPASQLAASDGLAAAVAAAVAATDAAAPASAPQPKPRPKPVGEDLTALIGATGAAQEELASMSGAALTGLRALRGAAAQGPTLDELVARAAQAGAQDDYIKALQEEASR